MTSPTSRLSQEGVSIWLDDLSRSRLKNDQLAQLVRDYGVVGVTTNPAIFQQALTNDGSYRAAIVNCAQQQLSIEQTITQLTTDDVRDACDLFAPIFETSGGVDGRVSIEVEPALAHDVEATVARAQELWERIDRPNLMIKIPATQAGILAITETISRGISVNVTLIFSLTRYREIANAYLTGLERARSGGLDISSIHSVASFFISRLDSAVDPILRHEGSSEALSLRGTAGIANARLAYDAFLGVYASERAQYLVGLGANVQRLLWASTGVKDPDFADTMYVTELVAPNVVNTMPEQTLVALADHGDVQGDTVTQNVHLANTQLNELERFGVDYTALTDQLEREGLEKFADSWNMLLQEVRRIVEIEST